VVAATLLDWTALLDARHVVPLASMRYRLRSVKPPCPAVGYTARGSLHCRVGRIVAPGNRFRSYVVSVPRSCTTLSGALGQPLNGPVTPSGPLPVPVAVTRGACRAPRLPADELTQILCLASSSAVAAPMPCWNTGSSSSAMSSAIIVTPAAARRWNASTYSAVVSRVLA